MMNEPTKLTPDEVNKLATAHFGTITLKWLEESANSFARAVEDMLIKKNVPQPAQPECTCNQGQACAVCDPIHPVAGSNGQ